MHVCMLRAFCTDRLYLVKNVCMYAYDLYVYKIMHTYILHSIVYAYTYIYNMSLNFHELYPVRFKLFSKSIHSACAWQCT